MDISRFFSNNPFLIKPPSGGVRGMIDVKVVPLLNWAIALSALVAVVMLIYGGYTFMTSAGDPDKVTKGRNVVIASIVGMIIVFLARAIVGLVLEKMSEGGL